MSKICPCCNKAFEVKEGKKKNKFCSLKCYRTVLRDSYKETKHHITKLTEEYSDQNALYEYENGKLAKVAGIDELFADALIVSGAIVLAIISWCIFSAALSMGLLTLTGSWFVYKLMKL